MKLTIEETPTRWFGDFDFGGCFLADAFTLSCEDLKDDFIKITNNPEFIKKCEDVIAKFDKSDINIINYEGLNIVEVDINLTGIIVQALMALEMNRKKIVSGIKYYKEAVAITEVCNYLGIPLKLYLCRELGKMSSLKSYLNRSNIEFNIEYCEELFNLPGMYAFQEWVGLPQDIFLLNFRSNLGAYPFPSISSILNMTYGQKMVDSWSDKIQKTPETIIVPCISGTTALAVFRHIIEEDINLISIELEDFEMEEERDSYCGAFTLARRDKKRDRVIAPELAYLWKSGKVERVFVSRKEAAEELKKLQLNCISTSLESAAAVKYARNIDEQDVMVVTGKPRAGMVV